MQKYKLFLFMVVFLITLVAYNFVVQASAISTIDVTAKIAGDRFWSAYYTTAYGNEDTITLYKLKKVIIEIRSDKTIVDSFTFTPDSPQEHHFLVNTSLQDIRVQYRGITYTDYEFSFSFDYKPGGTLSVANNTSQIIEKNPFLTYN